MSVDNIKVAIKARPVLKKEKDCNFCWRISNNSIQLIESQTEPFYFDHIFDQNASNENIFNTVIKPIVNSCVEGINGTIFAYGQTSSGKTYTMLGDEENPGVMILAVKEIFKFIQSCSDRLFLLRVGYIEIYNEKIYDLLNKHNQDLKIHELGNGEVSVNCSEFIVTTETDILKYLQAGNKIRKFAETNMNERSSRSHAIFKLTIESREIQKSQESQEEAFQISSLNLVDLAGSERADQTGATGSRLKEGSHINKSLLSLGCVIKSLSENAESDSFINYRNSKLTRILQASLGGNALTAIICNIKLTTIEETNSTLSFAMRAKTIKNKPHVNEVISDAAMMKILEKKVSKLQCELELERKKNSKLKILELEKQIKDEKHKIVNPLSLKIEKCNRNRRKTWAPSTSENNCTSNNEIFTPVEPQQFSKCETKSSINKVPKFVTPLITVRDDTQNNNFTPNEDDLFKESPILDDSFLLEITNNVNCFQTPKSIKNSIKLDLTKTPCLKDKYEILERDLKELETFTSLEKKLDVNHDMVNSLISSLESCRSEICIQNEKIQKLHEIKLNSEINNENLNETIENLKLQIEDKNKLIENLERSLVDKDQKINLESREKVNLECEFEQIKNKFKVRENELLDLIKEKNEKLKKVDELQEKNNTDLMQRSSFKLGSTSNKWCNNCLQIIENNDSKNYLIKIMENNNTTLNRKCANLYSKYLQIEVTFNKLKNDFENNEVLLKNKETESSKLNEEFEKLKYDYESQTKEYNVIKNRLQSFDYENQNLKLTLANNSDLIVSVGQECTSLRKLISTLVQNMNKLEEERDVLFSGNMYEDARILRTQNNANLEQLQSMEQLLQQKDRNILKFVDFIKNISFNFSILKSQLNEMNACMRMETTYTQENLKTLNRLIQHSLLKENDISQNISTAGNFLNISNSFYLENDDNDINLLREKIRIIEKENKDFRIIETQMKHELELLRRENENLSEKILESIMDLDVLTEENNKIKMRNEILDKEIDSLKVNLTLTTNENGNLKTINGSLTSKFESVNVENKDMINQLHNLNNTIKMLNDKCDISKKRCDEINVSWNDSKIQLDMLNKEVEKLKPLSENLKKNKKDLEVINESLKTEIHNHANKYEALKCSKENLEVKLTNILQELDKFKNDKQILSEKVENYLKKNEILMKIQQDLEDEKENLTLKLEDCLKNYDHLNEDKKTSLKTLQNKMEVERENFIKEIKCLQEEKLKLEYLKSDNDKNLQEMLEMKNVIKILNNKIIDLKLENETICKEISEIKDDNLKQKLSSELEEVKISLHQCKNEIGILKMEKNNLKEDHKKMIETLICEINQLKIKNPEIANEIEKKELKQTENWRKVKRQSCHDETRSFFFEPLKDSSTMTEPTDELCNCMLLANKISELKKLLLIKDSQITALNLKVSYNTNKEEVQKLKKDLLAHENENKTLNLEIHILKEQIDNQSRKYSDHLRQAVCDEKSEGKKLNQKLIELNEQLNEQSNKYVEKLKSMLNEKEKYIQENEFLKENLKKETYRIKQILINKELEQKKILKEVQQFKCENKCDECEKKFNQNQLTKKCVLIEIGTQTDEFKENDNHLQKINQDLKKLCRYRHSKIDALKQEIENLKKYNV